MFFLGDEDRVERQVFFNAELKVIPFSDPPDKSYHRFLTYLEQSDIELNVAADIVPVLELVILADPAGLLFYRVKLETYDALTRKQWLALKECIDQQLDEFEMEKFGITGRAFYPMKKDEEETKAKAVEGSEKLIYARKLEKLYHAVCKRLKTMVASKTPDAEIARRYHIQVSEIREQFYSGKRPKIAELAKKIVLNRGSRLSYLAKKLGIVEPSQFDDCILHRHKKGPDGKERPDYYHKMSRVDFGKRIRLEPREEEIPER